MTRRHGALLGTLCAALAGLGAVAFVTPTRAAPGVARGASYTASQAARGRLQYYESCAECHGGKLEGQFGPALAGGDDNLQYQSVADVYEYMATHMPHGNPESLSQEQYVAVMAFLMQAHGLPAGARTLTAATIDADKALMGDGR